MKKLIVIFLFGIISQTSFSQKLFGDSCIGVWNGTMYIYGAGTLRDSVKVNLTVAKTTNPNEWTWRTEYFSVKMPIVKDYKLRLKDAGKNIYVTDEGGGIELVDYLFDNKLYCVFETQNILLTSTYELKGNELIFEVTSGKRTTDVTNEVINHAVNNLQRVVFHRQ